MTNFNPDQHDNAINPYTLTKEKQREVIKIIDDERLSNPPGDYFRLELKEGSIDIPKLKYIGTKTKDGRISRLSITDYILRRLSE